MKWWVGVAVLLSACSDGPKDPVALVTEWKAAVVVSDFTTGRLVSLEGGDPVPVHGDAIVRRRPDGGWLVVNRLGGDNLQWVSADRQVEAQVSVGRGSNPQDAMPWGSGTWVSHLRRPDLVWWDKEGGEGRTLDLCKAGHCDADGFGEPTFFHRQGNRLFVLLQRLDIPGGYVPAGESRILEIDPEGASVLRSYPLRFENPVTEFKSMGEWVFVGGVGFREVRDGGIERWNLQTGESVSVISESALGGDLVDFAPLSLDQGVAIVGRGKTTHLVRYGADGVQPFAEGFSDAGGFYWLKVLARDGLVFLLDRDPARVGIHVFQGGERVQFLPTLLPPYWMEFE